MSTSLAQFVADRAVTYLAVGHSQSPPADLSWLWAALIGVGGAIVGGAVGGMFALRAGRQWSENDRQAAITARSEQAAMTIAAEVLDMQTAVSAWRDNHDAAALATAWWAFSRAAAIQVMALTDSDVVTRVADFTESSARLVDPARRGESEADDLASTVVQEADDLMRALSAYTHRAVASLSGLAIGRT